MEKSAFFSFLVPIKVKWACSLFCFYKITLFVFFILISSKPFAQLPDANSCTSKDLLLVSASLPPNVGENICTCGGTRTLMLTINNKTGSIRTAFALWGTLIITGKDGIEKPGVDIFACAGTIPASSITTLASDKTITFECGESLKIVNLFLAWTTANKKEDCAMLKANPSLIAPKCGTLGEIQILAGVDATINNKTDATCKSLGSVTVSPFGGEPPYSAAIGTDVRNNISTGGSEKFYLAAGTYSVTIIDHRGCTVTKTTGEIKNPDPVTAEAGASFTKTCIENTGGKQIGESDNTNFTFSWTPTGGLSNSNVSNPTANPTTTTTYEVTKTNVTTGCTATDVVTVTVNTAAVTAKISGNKELTCTTTSITLDASGSTSQGTKIYAWYKDNVLLGSKTAATLEVTEPGAYKVLVTDNDNGCSDDESVTVSQDIIKPIATISGNKVLTCTTTSIILDASGSTSQGTKVYAWYKDNVLLVSKTAATLEVTSPGVYKVVVKDNDNGCSDDESVTVTQNNTLPSKPDICVVEPSLCGPATGSITILSPIGDMGEYAYSINNGLDYTPDKTIWSDLAAGSNPRIMVKRLSTGCESGAVDCSASDCSGLAGFNSGTKNEALVTGTKQVAAESEFSVKAYPNPFSDEVKFIVTVPVSGKGSLELFNMTGQKVKTIYQGLMNAGINSYEVKLTAKQSATLIYMLRVGEKQLTGKLLHNSQ